MAAYRSVGPGKRDEINPQRFWHDMRRGGAKFADIMSTPMSAAVLYFVLSAVGFFLPALADVNLLVGIGFFFFIKKSHLAFKLPVKIPRQAKMLDPHELHPGTGKPTPSMGTFYLGNDRITKEEIWLTNRDAGVHMLVLGTTGSGKTELLLGICQNALNHGSGFMFVDGKAQDKIAFKIIDLVRARGRDDDFLALNFMTGAKDIIGAQPGKITNTMNPFSYGSSGMVSQIVVGLMASGGGGDDMWKDRAISFVEALSPPLTYLRDNYNVMLDVNKYRQFFELDRVEELAWKAPDTYPGLGQVIEAAQNYLINLPGYDRNKFGKRGGQGEDTRLQHGFITMQLVRAFTSLADTYGHIVRVPMGEVYFPDLVKQRRILVVMLPSLEKTPSETANIGKIIVTALRNIMAEGLGSVLEGDRKELENEDGRAMLPPYVVILDEYGYYAVKGFAVAFAQARSLGFVCVVGGQDLASFQRESKEEAVSICGNTRIKLFGAIEDPEQTMKFVVETAGKAMVAKSSNYESEAGAAGMSYKDQMAVNFETLDRINPSDIKEQTEGMFTIVWRSSTIRMQCYYVNPAPVSKVRLNHFIPVPPPTAEQLLAIENTTSGLVKRFASADLSETVMADPIREIDAAVFALENAKSNSLGVIESGIVAIVAVGIVTEQYRRNFSEALISGGRNAGAPDTYKKIAATKPTNKKKQYNAFDEDLNIQDGMLPDPVGTFQSELDERDAQMVEFANSGAPDVSPDDLLNDPNGIRVDGMEAMEQMNVFVPARRDSGFGADVFSSDSDSANRIEAILAASEEEAPLLDYNKTYKGVEKIERAMGATDEEAGAAARQVVKTIEDATRYPQSVPKEKSVDQVKDLLEDLIGLLGDD
jgi:intracellular multiplication protein IcmO